MQLLGVDFAEVEYGEGSRVAESIPAQHRKVASSVVLEGVPRLPVLPDQ